MCVYECGVICTDGQPAKDPTLSTEGQLLLKAILNVKGDCEKMFNALGSEVVAMKENSQKGPRKMKKNCKRAILRKFVEEGEDML